MSLFSIFGRKSKTEPVVEKKANTIPAVISTPITGRIDPPIKAEESLKHILGWVYSCETAIANRIAAIPIHLYKKRGEEVEEVNDGPLINLLYRINDFTTKFDHFWLMTQYLLSVGEAPLFLGINGGIPTDILLLRPDRLTAKFSKETIIDHWEYKKDYGSKPVRIEREELILLRIPDPETPFRGKGVLSAAAKTVDIDNASESWNFEFFKNSARPDVVLTTEQSLNQEQVNDLSDKWKKKYAGSGNRYKLAILTNGLKPEKMSLSQRDMEFLEQQKFSRDKILSIFGTPKSVVSITDDVNRANAEAGNYAFAVNTIRPMMRRITEQLNEFLVPFFGYDLFLDFEDPVPEDQEAKLKRYDNALKNGWMAINEVRKIEGLEPIDGCDTPYLPMSYVPVGSSSIPEESEENKSIKPNPEFIKQLNSRRSTKDSSKNKKTIESIDETIKDLARSLVGKKEEDKKNPMGIEEKWWRNQIKIADRFESLFKSKLVGIFNRQKKEVLKKLSGKKAAIVPAKVGVDIDKEVGVFIKVFLPILRSLTKEEGDRTLDALNPALSMDLGSSNVKKYLDKNIIKFSKAVSVVTNKKIRKTLAAGIESGEGMPKLAKRVSGIFTSATKERSMIIARTETMRTTNFASVEAYKQSGQVKAIKWLAEMDDRTCPYCQSMNGKTIALGQNFFEEGDTYFGSAKTPMVMDYGSIPYPPLHVSCRCTTFSVTKQVGSTTTKSKKKKTIDINIIRKKAQELLKKEKDEELEKLKKANKRVDKLLKENG